jgi:hypothetical protein
MAEIIENGHTMQHQSIPNGKINAGLTLGIIGTSLAGLMALNGNNGGGLLSGLFGGNNGGGCGCQKQTSCVNNMNTAYIMDAEELYLERQASADKLAATNRYYQGVIDFNKTLTDSFFASYERDVKNSFDLYKLSRDQKDELTQKIEAVDKKVDVMAAIRPYQDALLNAKIDQNALIADFNLSRRTCRMITGELVLPSTPTVTGYASYSPCNPVQAPTT